MTLPPHETLHAQALEALTRWPAPTATQEALRQRYVAHLRGVPDGVGRAAYPDHLTASTLVLSADHTQVLLTLHAKAKRWFQFGGHCEEGDLSLAAAAAREAHEESGIRALIVDEVPVQLSEHEVPFCDPRGRVHHLDVRFVAVAPAAAEHSVSDESLDVAWWPADALPDPEPELVELVRLAQSRVESRRQSSDPGGGSSRAAADHPLR